MILRDDPAVTSERSDAELLRNQLYARVGRAQLTELLLAVHGETHFSWELLRRAPVAPEELVPVYAALFVAAMGLDMTDVAIMIPGVRLADIRRVSRLLEEDRGLRRANDVVVEFMLAHPIAKAWGEGFEASSDLMSLDVNRNLWLSRVDPKRRRHAVGTCTHVLDQWGIVYDQPLLLATRQAGAAIEGAVRQSITHLERLAVDTHGYVDFGMAIAKLLNLDLCPRLYSLRDRHLHLPLSFFCHFGTFRLSMWHFISACAMTRRKPNDTGSKASPDPSIDGLNICKATTSFVGVANTNRLVFFF